MVSFTSSAVMFTSMTIVAFLKVRNINSTALAALGIVSAAFGSLGIGLLLGVPLKVTAFTTVFAMLPLSLICGLGYRCSQTIPRDGQPPLTYVQL
ncbi:MAG: hypothetical protein H0V82_02770 [Candidatus Protochlamydia sp.]|nr:hypothetical protein [Candidatus Protochlamydia sp.]